ncbi:hypothetical protein Taro_010759 [Colocasia esculenta]|uniref:Uncharacterized protein n=1 Tax=Colocasia esculenta TaxID=4460 RepID=A0A843U7X5_COLES|nr:hypothetical protein [Colocasia esculenta]
MISPIPRFSGSSDSLNYANRWQSTHTDPACHGDRKSCSTRREISTPAVPFDRTQISVRPGVETSCEAPIRNRHFDPVAKRLHLEISGLA